MVDPSPTICMRRHRPLLAHTTAQIAGVVTASFAPLARADLQDEIQVYDDAINAPGEFGIELHINATPAAAARPTIPAKSRPTTAGG